MNWITLYIVGKAEFKEEVWKRLENGRLEIMPGYLDSTSGKGFYDLYWIGEKISIREVKEAIGSKLIWKYRLRFYTELEDFLSAGEKKSEAEPADDTFEIPIGLRKSA